MKFNKLCLSIVAVVFLCSIPLAGQCKSPKTTNDAKADDGWIAEVRINIDKKLFNNWVAAIKENHDACKSKHSCRDFVVTCTKPVKISRADQLNKVTERRRYGITFTGFYHSKFTESKELARFEKKNGVWEKKYTFSSATSDVESCTTSR